MGLEQVGQRLSDLVESQAVQDSSLAAAQQGFQEAADLFDDLSQEGVGDGVVTSCFKTWRR